MPQPPVHGRHIYPHTSTSTIYILEYVEGGEYEVWKPRLPTLSTDVRNVFVWLPSGQADRKHTSLPHCAVDLNRAAVCTMS